MICELVQLPNGGPFIQPAHVVAISAGFEAQNKKKPICQIVTILGTEPGIPIVLECKTLEEAQKYRDEITHSLNEAIRTAYLMLKGP